MGIANVERSLVRTVDKPDVAGVSGTWDRRARHGLYRQYVCGYRPFASHEFPEVAY